MITNPDFIAIFDRQTHLRATLLWKEDVFVLKGISHFDNADIKTFLSWLTDHDPRRRVEREHKMYLSPTSKTDPEYRNAVWQELGIQGFSVHPIEEYQEDFLLELNDSRFDKVRENILGDLLTFSKEDASNFIKDLKEGAAVVKELDELK